MKKRSMKKARILLFSLLFLSAAREAEGKSVLLEDFNTKRTINHKILSFHFTWQNPPGECRASYTSDPQLAFGRSGSSLKLRYDIRQGEKAFCGYAFRFNRFNMTPYKYLSFWVRGAKGGEFFKIEMKCRATKENVNSRQARIYITDYLDNGVTPQWQKVVIPLDAFGSLEQRTNMREMTITFEHTQCRMNESPLQGTIYLDDLVMGDWDPGCVRFDHFGDRIEINGFGGNSSFANSSNALLSSRLLYTNNSIFPCVLELNYQVGARDSYVFYYNLFGGGTNGFQAMPVDLSAYDALTFWIRCGHDEIEQVLAWPWRGLKVELDTDDDSAVNYFTFVEVTDTWEKVSIPLTNFRKNGYEAPFIDSSRISKLVWVLDGFYLHDEDRTNVVYLDSIQFEKKGYRPDSDPPASPSWISANNEYLHNGFELDIKNDLRVHLKGSAEDPSLETIFCEYSLDEGLTWRRIGADYDTSDDDHEFFWDTAGFVSSSRVRLRASAMDASGNVSSAAYDCLISGRAGGSREEQLQAVLSPNNDGLNDIIIFSRLSRDSRIFIYSKDGQLVKTIRGKDHWDGCGEDGRLVNSGIYVFHIESKTQKRTGTIIVVR